MKLRKSAISVEMLFLIVFLPVISVSYADDASVLPKGVSRVMLDSNFYFPVDQRYGPDGGAEDVAADYNRSLNSSVFSALAPLDPFVPGLPSIGDSIVSFQYHFTMLNLGFQYGVTDKLSMGITIPYWWIENDVEARLDSGTGSSANVGKNPCFGAAGCPSTSPIIPIASGGVRMDTEDVQALLGR